ncbi:MAG: ABC transporter ATP-binding protein [Frankiaceae bacterium]
MTSPMAWHTLSGFRRDRSVARRKLAPGTVRRIARFAAPYKRWLGVFLVLILFDAVITVLNPLILKQIIDKGVAPGAPKGDPALVVRLALLVAALAVVDAGINLVQRWYSARIGEGLIYDMRSKVYDHVQRMPIAFFTRTQTGALISRLNNDVLGAQQAFTGTLSSVVSNLLTVSLVIAAMLTLSWQITLISLVLLPVFLLPARMLGACLQQVTRESYGLDAQMNATMSERFNVAGALLVKLYGRPEREAAAFRDKAGRVRDIGVISAMYSRIFFVALSLVAALATAITYGMGGVMAAQRTLEIGTLVALTAYLARLYGPLTALSNVRVDVMTALVSFERVFEVLDLPPAIADKPGAVQLPRTAATIEFDEVDFRYPAAEEVSLASLESVAVLDKKIPQQVLHGVSFSARAGELVALVGPSGAGKTTISQLVTRMYDVQAGSVQVGGLDVRDVTLQSLRDAVGVVTQDPHMFHATIGENLRHARDGATDEQLWTALDAAQVGDLVRSLPDGLDTVVGERGYRLSGGEKQRIAIARVLLKEPGIVVLDEATAHLDSESELAVQRALATALRGRTSLVIAHRLSTIQDADRILVVDGGRVVDSGRHEDLLVRGGLYAELYRTQFQRQRAADVVLDRPPTPDQEGPAEPAGAATAEAAGAAPAEAAGAAAAASA